MRFVLSCLKDLKATLHYINLTLIPRDCVVGPNPKQKSAFSQKSPPFVSTFIQKISNRHWLKGLLFSSFIVVEANAATITDATRDFAF